MGERYSSEINFKNIRLNSVYKALTNPDHWDKGFKTALQEFVKESRHLCKDWSGDLQTEKNGIDAKLDQVIDIYNNKQSELFITVFNNAHEIESTCRKLRYSHRDTILSDKYKKIAEKLARLEDYEAICQLSSNHVLYIKGEAGTGKSHLLADIVNQRMKRKMKSMLALGLDFNEIKDVKET